MQNLITKKRGVYEQRIKTYNSEIKNWVINEILNMADNLDEVDNIIMEKLKEERVWLTKTVKVLLKN